MWFISANLHPSPAGVRAFWPTELPSGGGLEPNLAPNEPRFWGQRGPENEPKQAQNCQKCQDHFWAKPFVTIHGPEIGHFGGPVGWAAGRRAPPPPPCIVQGEGCRIFFVSRRTGSQRTLSSAKLGKNHNATLRTVGVLYSLLVVEGQGAHP